MQRRDTKPIPLIHQTLTIPMGCTNAATLFLLLALTLTLTLNYNNHGTDDVRTYIVHLLKPDGAELLSDLDLEEWHKTFLPNTTLSSGEPRLVYSYKHAINGFAARLTRREVEAMETMDGFLAAVPDEPVHLLTTYTPTYMGLNQWKSPWKQPNYGEGIIIGIVDTGITPSHPSFDGGNVEPPPRGWRGRCDLASACNNKLIAAVAFPSGSGGATALDLDGHGTAVASVAAGSIVEDAAVYGINMGTASGMAPGAHLAVYSYCTDRKTCRVADAAKAVDQAVADGVDVLTLSNKIAASDARALHKDTLGIAAFAAVKNGIATVAAAGNGGPASGTVHNAAPWVLTVGSSATNRGIKTNGAVWFRKPHPCVAYTSGRGPAPHDGGIAKPDVVGPGEDIIVAGTNATSASPFTVSSGSSLAAAHIAGVVALLKKSHPEWSAAAVKSAIMTTASRFGADGEPLKDMSGHLPASIHAMGAGQVEPWKANDPGLVYDLTPSEYYPYLCGLGYNDKQVSAIAGEPVSCCVVGKVRAEELNYPSITVTMSAWEKKVKVERTVSNVAEWESEYYRAVVVEPEGMHVHVHPKEMEFKRVGEERTFKVVVRRREEHHGRYPVGEKGTYLEGQVAWVSEHHVVRSPLVIGFD